LIGLTSSHHNSAGNGGDGYFAGSLVDINVRSTLRSTLRSPATPTAEAHQSNNVEFDQSAIQIAESQATAYGNAALGGDLAMHLLADLHLLILPYFPFR
jgi:hypothetical protein